MPLNQRMDEKKCGTFTQQSTTQGERILQFAWKWKELENTFLFEVTQILKQENSITHSKVETTYKAKDNQSIVHNPREAR